MPEAWCDGIGPGEEEQIKRAAASTCELCREYLPLTDLGLHGIPPVISGKERDPKERERNIIIVCEPCHRLIHAEPVPEEKLRARIANRTFHTRREILAALGYVPKPVLPPEDQDFRRVYDDTLKDFSGHYR